MPRRAWSEVVAEIVVALEGVPESTLFERAAAVPVFEAGRARTGLFVTLPASGKAVPLRKAFPTKSSLVAALRGEHPYEPLAWLPFTLLSACDPVAALPFALAAIESDAPSGVRNNAAVTLAASRDDRALEALLSLLDAGDPAARHIAVCVHPDLPKALAARLSDALARWEKDPSDENGHAADQLVGLLGRIRSPEALELGTQLGLLGPRPTYGAAHAAIALDRKTAFDRLSPHLAPARLTSERGRQRARAILDCLHLNDLNRPRLLDDPRWYEATLEIVRAGHLLAAGYVFEGIAARRGGKMPEEALTALIGLAGKIPDEQLHDWLVRRFARESKRTLRLVEARLAGAADDQALARLRDALRSLD